MFCPKKWNQKVFKYSIAFVCRWPKTNNVGKVFFLTHRNKESRVACGLKRVLTVRAER